MQIIKTYTVIRKTHKDQNWLWKRLHQAKMLVCKHSLEPMEDNEFTYHSGESLASCINCEALCKIKGS